MSDLTFNKIAGGLLATGLVIFGLRELTTIVFEQEPPETPGYAVAVVEETEAGPVAEVAPDWGTVIPVASVEVGAAISQKCLSCHTFDAGGANKIGPNLFGILGRKPGSHPGFAYSSAMTGYAGTHPAWTWDELDQFLKAPSKHMPDTKMTFVGLKKQEDRVAMLAYLNSLGATLPLPAPKPAVVATAPAEGAAPAATAPTATGSTATPVAPATAPTKTASGPAGH